MVWKLSLLRLLPPVPHRLPGKCVSFCCGTTWCVRGARITLYYKQVPPPPPHLKQARAEACSEKSFSVMKGFSFVALHGNTLQLPISIFFFPLPFGWEMFTLRRTVPSPELQLLPPPTPPKSSPQPHALSAATILLLYLMNNLRAERFVSDAQLLPCSCAINHLSELIHANAMPVLFGKHLGPGQT